MMRHRQKQLFWLAVALFCAGTVRGMALQAVAQQIPSSVNPGVLNNAPENREPIAPAPRPGDAEPDVKLEVPSQSQQVQINSPKFRITQIRLEGNTLLKPGEVQPLIQEYEGKELSLDELGGLVEKLNALYRKRGWLTSQVYIPPQDIEGGIVKLQAVEGKVGDIEMSGNKLYRRTAILRSLPQQEGEPLNVTKLERNLNSINQQDQFRLRATLTPGDKQGETDIRLDVAERQPWQITPTFDDQGRPYIGQFRWGTEISNQNLLGYGDRLFAKWVMSARSVGVNSSYFVPVNRFGTEIGGVFGYNHVNVDLGHAVTSQPQILGDAYTYGLVVSQPITRDRTWVADTGFTAKRISTFINGDHTRKDDIRSVYAGLTFNKVDNWGRTYARGQFTYAPDWMDASTKFWKAETYLTRMITLPANNLLILRAYGQFTPDPLVPAEQMQIGGAYSVRGYSEGVLLGDRGYQFNIEHRWPIPFLRLASPWLADRLQGAFFFDIAQVFTSRDHTTLFGGQAFRGGYSNLSKNTTLAGAGVGLRFRLTQYLYGFTDCGFALVRHTGVEPVGYSLPTARIHFGLRSDILPYTYSNQTQTASTSQPFFGHSHRNKAVTPAASATPVTAPADSRTPEHPVTPEALPPAQTPGAGESHRFDSTAAPTAATYGSDPSASTFPYHTNPAVPAMSGSDPAATPVRYQTTGQ